MIDFKNLRDLLGKLSNEDACREHLEQIRWNGDPQCPFCQAHKPYKLKSGRHYRCKEKTCRKTFTVTVDTVMENTKIHLSIWIVANYVLSAHKKGISSCQLARDLGITQKTAWFVLHRLRYAMGMPDTEPLNNVVEIDETYVGGKFALMSRQRRKKWQDLGQDNKTAVMGLLERDGKARLTVIGGKTFKNVVRENVKTDAVLVTDTHLGYQGLWMEYAGHETVNHSQMEFRNGIAYTNSVEGFFSSLKRSIFGIYHQVSPKHLQQYCSETAYRYNTRKLTDKDRSNHSLKNIEGRRLTYNTLIQRKNETI